MPEWALNKPLKNVDTCSEEYSRSHREAVRSGLMEGAGLGKEDTHMMMSMFSSVSGLKAHQTRMDVIGNNIANVNTVGFKGSRATFQEIFSQTLNGSGAPDSTTGRGGTNPMQIGLGMNIDAIDTMMSRGSVQRTDSPTDLSIEGEGFFVVRNGAEGAYTFTRAGNFTIDKVGNLVTSDGANVYGWMKYTLDEDGYEFDMQEPIKALNLYDDEYNLNKRIIAAQVTTAATLAGNLNASETPVSGNSTTPVGTGALGALGQDAVDSTGAAGADGIPDNGVTNEDPHFTVPLTVYDTLGNDYKVNIKLWKNFVDTSGASAESSWYWTVDGGDNSTAAASGFLKFDARGKLITDDTAFPPTVDVTLTPDSSVGTDPFTFSMNLTKLSMYADDSSVSPQTVDGYPPGTLTTFSIGADGILTGVYDNGRQQPLGLVSLATFANPAGLAKVGSNLFAATSNSGDFTFGTKPGNDGAGTISPGTLEMSNVDLAKQFTEMIITQRGFQANSRVMTTSDEILQEMANLKR